MTMLPELVNAGGVPSHPCPWCRGETRNARETELCKEHLRALVARERAAAKLSVVCAWCQARISGPDPVPGAPVSHGICQRCLAEQKEELKRGNPPCPKCGDPSAYLNLRGRWDCRTCSQAALPRKMRKVRPTGDVRAPVGARVRLRRDVDRLPDAVVKAGATGTVVECTPGHTIHVAMDDPVRGLEQWDNEIAWFDEYLGDFTRDVEVVDLRRRNPGDDDVQAAWREWQRVQEPLSLDLVNDAKMERLGGSALCFGACGGVAGVSCVTCGGTGRMLPSGHHTESSLALARLMTARERRGLSPIPRSAEEHGAMLSHFPGRKLPKKLTCSQAEEAIVEWLVHHGWVRDPQSHLIAQRGRGRGGHQHEVWVNKADAPTQRLTFGRRSVFWEVGKRGQWAKNYKVHAYGNELLTTQLARQLLDGTEWTEALRVNPRKKRKTKRGERGSADRGGVLNAALGMASAFAFNPDEDLRRLERAAATGDPQAHEALQRHLQRVGLPTDAERARAAYVASVAEILDQPTELRAHLEGLLVYANGRRRTRTVSWDQLRNMILMASISDPRGGYVDTCERVANAYKYRAYTTNVLVVRDGDYLSVGAIEGPAKACSPGRAWHELQPWRPNTAAGLRKRITWARSPGVVVIPLPTEDGRERQLCDVALPLIPPEQGLPEQGNPALFGVFPHAEKRQVKGYPQQRAVAAALSIARKKGYRVPKRVNSDEEMRRLERAAAAGDFEAQRRLEAIRARVSPPPEDEDDPHFADECQTCGGEERVHYGLCAWCHADEEGRPYGSCLSCGGARAQDRTCACRPNPKKKAKPPKGPKGFTYEQTPDGGWTGHWESKAAAEAHRKRMAASWGAAVEKVTKKKNPDDEIRRLEREAATGGPDAQRRYEVARLRAGLPVEERRKYLVDLAGEAVGPQSGTGSAPSRKQIAVGVRAVLKAEKFKGLTVTTPKHAWASAVDLSGAPPYGVTADGAPGGHWISAETHAHLQKLFYGHTGGNSPYPQQSMHLSVWNREDRSDPQSDYWHPGGPSLPWWLHDTFKAALVKAVAGAKARAACSRCKKHREVNAGGLCRACMRATAPAAGTQEGARATYTLSCGHTIRRGGRAYDVTDATGTHPVCRACALRFRREGDVPPPPPRQNPDEAQRRRERDAQAWGDPASREAQIRDMERRGEVVFLPEGGGDARAWDVAVSLGFPYLTDMASSRIEHSLFPGVIFSRAVPADFTPGAPRSHDRPGIAVGHDAQANRWVVLPEPGAVLREVRAPEPEVRVYQPWTVESRGDSWGVLHIGSGKWQRVGRVGGPQGRGRGTNYRDRARDLANRLNRELSDDDVCVGFLNGMQAHGRRLTSEIYNALSPSPSVMLSGNWMGGAGIAHWTTQGTIQENDIGSKAAQLVHRRLRRLIRQGHYASGMHGPQRPNPPMLVMGMGSMAAAGLMNPPGGDLYEEATRPTRKGRRGKKGPGERGPMGKGPKYKKKRITLEEAANYPGFDDAVKAYREFHQAEPAYADAYTYDDGQQEHTVKVVVGLGEVPETHYVTPFKKSNKKGYHWIHHHPKGHQPLEVLDPATGTTSKIGGTYRINDWWRK